MQLLRVHLLLHPVQPASGCLCKTLAIARQSLTSVRQSLTTTRQFLTTIRQLFTTLRWTDRVFIINTHRDWIWQLVVLQLLRMHLLLRPVQPASGCLCKTVSYHCKTVIYHCKTVTYHCKTVSYHYKTVIYHGIRFGNLWCCSFCECTSCFILSSLLSRVSVRHWLLQDSRSPL